MLQLPLTGCTSTTVALPLLWYFYLAGDELCCARLSPQVRLGAKKNQHISCPSQVFFNAFSFISNRFLSFRKLEKSGLNW